MHAQVSAHTHIHTYRHCTAKQFCSHWCWWSWAWASASGICNHWSTQNHQPQPHWTVYNCFTDQMVSALSLSLTHTHTHSLSLSLSHTHTHTHTNVYAHTTTTTTTKHTHTHTQVKKTTRWAHKKSCPMPPEAGLTSQSHNKINGTSSSWGHRTANKTLIPLTQNVPTSHNKSGVQLATPCYLF